MGGLKLVILVSVMMGGAPQEAPTDDRLYGRVTTSGGDVIEGFLRWDRNEGSWVDLLNGDKEIPWQNLREAEELDDRDRRRRDRDRSVSFMGIRISWDEDDMDGASRATSGLRFGHIETLEVNRERGARITLKSGEELELSGGSTDLGPALRRMVVEERDGRETALRWRDLDRIDFMAAPAGGPPPAGERLYGTLTTWSGEVFTGFVAWDVDEIFTTDVLDGEERGRTREIEFERIGSIERAGRSGARVTLTNGETLELRGTNDVNDGNRGIAISDPGLGQVQVRWEDFESVVFETAPAGVGAYESFSGGAELYGRVETERGDPIEGYIRWDNDEEFTWEMLDGSDSGIDFDIEFGNISVIEKRGDWGADVELHDGRVFRLEDSNDVNDDNKGIFVRTEDGETILIHWEDFDRVVFAR